MKYSIILILLLPLLFVASDDRKVPSVAIKKLNNAPFDTKNISNDGKPIIISFWATWCSPCKRQLNTIAEQYEDLQDETGVKLIAVSIDDSRNTAKVKSFVSGQGWNYEVLLDPHKDFKQAMRVNNIPHTFLIDGNGNIVWDINSYVPGDEEELYDLVVKLANEGGID